MIIEHLTLYTNQLQEQKSFYCEHLGFQCLSSTPESFTIQAGHSKLHFKESDRKPSYYHFAFNIPSYKSRDALKWLQTKVGILRDGETEMIDFSNWNAEAMYFHDPAGNVVEFIARRNLNLTWDGPFRLAAISGISEIGLPVADVMAAFLQLSTRTGIPQYWTQLPSFCAAGDEQGLFIIVDRNNKEWYPTAIPARPFPLVVEFRNQKTAYILNLRPGDDGLRVSELKS